MRRSGEAASASTDRWIAEGSDIEPASERGRIGLQAEPQSLRRCEVEIAERPVRQLARAAETRALLQRELDRLNATLPRFATVKRFTILPREFLESEGEVTPSQKVKRKLIEKRYRVELDAMYPEPATAA